MARWVRIRAEKFFGKRKMMKNYRPAKKIVRLRYRESVGGKKMDKDKAIEELLDSMKEEYFKGATAMLNHLKVEVTKCYGINDGCSICVSGEKFLKKRKVQKIETLQDIKMNRDDWRKKFIKCNKENQKLKSRLNNH